MGSLSIKTHTLLGHSLIQLLVWIQIPPCPSTMTAMLHSTESTKSSRESTSTQLLPMLSSQSHMLAARMSIKTFSLTSSSPNTSKHTTPTPAAVSQAALPTLVLTPWSLLQPVSTAIPKQDYGTIPTTELAHVSQAFTLTQPKPSNATPAQPFTAQSAILWTQPNAIPAPLEDSSTTSPSLVLAQLDTMSAELLANNAPTNAKPVLHPMEPVQLALIQLRETVTKTVNVLSASMTLAQ